MARTSVREPGRPRGRRTFSGAVVAGVIVVLIFALLGVVSAGVFVAGKVSSSASATATPPASTGQTQAASIAISRAHAQATAIVRQAQVVGRTIVGVATSRANKQVKKMLASARRQAQSVPTVSAPASVATAVPYQPIATVAPSVAQGSASTGGSTASGTSGSATPNLSGLPASWKVVGYNAAFGSGPGSAGSITVTNRSSSTFSGYARVTYARGGSATAYFSGIAPGQTEVLALNGRPYSGGGYSISVVPH